MRAALLAALEYDYKGTVAVLDAFLRSLTEAREMVDVNIAAGTAVEEIRQIGQEAGK